MWSCDIVSHDAPLKQQTWKNKHSCNSALVIIYRRYLHIFAFEFSKVYFSLQQVNICYELMNYAVISCFCTRFTFAFPQEGCLRAPWTVLCCRSEGEPAGRYSGGEQWERPHQRPHSLTASCMYYSVVCTFSLCTLMAVTPCRVQPSWVKE